MFRREVVSSAATKDGTLRPLARCCKSPHDEDLYRIYFRSQDWSRFERKRIMEGLGVVANCCFPDPTLISNV